MRKLKLTEKLILYFLVIGVFTIVSISWYAYQSGRKAIISRTFDQLTSVRVVKQNLVEKYFADRFHELNIYSSSKGIQNLIQYIDNHNNTISTDALIKIVESDTYLTESFIENPNILVICLAFGDFSYKIVKAEGKIRLIENSYSLFQSHIFDNRDKNDFFIEEIQKPGKEEFSLLIGKGIVGIEINLSPIIAIMIENDPNSGWGKSGESYIVGKDHLMKTPSRFITPSVQKTKVASTAVIEGLSGHTGTDIMKDYRNIDVLSSYNKLNINGLDWVILAEYDLGEAMAPVNALRNEILFLSIFITSIVFFLAFLLARSISRPIRRLTSAAERIREGDYNVFVDVSHDDEIGSLTEAFNAMALQIRQQSRARIDGQDVERQRLSRELHDGLGQWLVAVRFRLESTDCTRPEVTRQNMDETKKLVDNIIDEIRRISNNLMPGVLQEFGLESALHAIAREISNSGTLKVNIKLETPLDILNTDYQIYLFRIIQEAMNNIVKHAEATESSIEIKKDDNTLLLKIKDNGKGFDQKPNSLSNGNGLVNMKERTHILKGEMEIITHPNEGTCLVFTLPLHEQN